MREDNTLGFLAQCHLPGVSRGISTTDDGNPAIALIAPDGSEALIETHSTNGKYRVTQSGPRQLWGLIEQIHTLWHTLGQPGYERFGITATHTNQYVWLDHPQGPHRWPLTTS
jgi:hypothetical protein